MSSTVVSSSDLPSDLWRLSAVEAVGLLRAGKVSPLELVEAAVQRIADTDPHLNAMPTLCLERARDHARALMDRPEAPEGMWLGGLPIAVKDLEDVAGVRTTYGSPIYADHVPETSDHMVERLEARGAIVIGKSNTPEFGAGASTFNEVFGKTRNPWNVAKSVAGSSGGAAAALAAGQVWLATGSDLGGSLRTPASFNGVIGLRPSPGRVPRGPKELPFQTLSVGGPMARTAKDTALFLDAMSGHHEGDPLALHEPEESFLASLESRRRLPKRVAFTADLGCLPVAREVAEICAAAARRFAEHGIAVEEATPDFTDALETFQVLRAALFAAEMEPILAEHREHLKPEVIWNIEKGMALSAVAIGRAEQARGALYRRMTAFFETYDLLLCPAACVAPFAVEERYVSEVEGHKFDNYVDWLAHCAAITITSCPALSVPAGLTAEGMPVGLQIVAPPRGEAAALTGALLLEELTGLHDHLPVDPRGVP
ncbi:MAG: amidase family protein [Pseudomonadota bacterium]